MLKPHILIPVFLAMWPMALSAESAVLELLPEAQVDLQGIFLKHLVTADNTAAIQLAPAPAWGETRVLTRADASKLISKAIPSANVTLAGAPEIRITRRSQLLEEEELLELLIKELQPGEDAAKTGELELQLSRPWKPISVPTDHLELKLIDRPSSGLTPSLYAKFQILSAGDPIGTYLISLRLHLYREVWVARSPVRRLITLDEADLVRDRRDIITIRQALWEGDYLDPSLQLVESVPTGGVVYARAVKQRPVIRRGDVVQAIANDGPLSVCIRVEALEDGAPDDVIRARNPRTRKEFRARIVNEQTIQLIF